MGAPALLLLGELPAAQLDGRDLLPRISGGLRRKSLTAARMWQLPALCVCGVMEKDGG